MSGIESEDRRELCFWCFNSGQGVNTERFIRSYDWETETDMVLGSGLSFLC